LSFSSQLSLHTTASLTFPLGQTDTCFRAHCQVKVDRCRCSSCCASCVAGHAVAVVSWTVLYHNRQRRVHMQMGFVLDPRCPILVTLVDRDTLLRTYVVFDYPHSSVEYIFAGTCSSVCQTLSVCLS